MRRVEDVNLSCDHPCDPRENRRKQLSKYSIGLDCYTPLAYARDFMRVEMGKSATAN